MKNPKLYEVHKIPIDFFVARDEQTKEYEIVSVPFNESFMVREADSQMFRMIRMITNDYSDFNKYIIFVDCNKYKRNGKVISKIISEPIIYNGIEYVVSESSASMSRGATLSFVDINIYDALNEKINMGIDTSKEMVISKYMAYKGLYFSSSHHLEDYIPKIIVVKDYEFKNKNNEVRYMDSEDAIYEVKDDNKNVVKKVEYKKKVMKNGVVDLDINAFDGCGLCHPNITQKIKDIIGIETTSESLMIRAPYMKGLLHSFDYPRFYREFGVSEIVDIFGVSHSIDDEMMIMSESMYKGIKYFGKNIDGWNNYWQQFKKHNHCISVPKFFYGFENEPIMTRLNYQVLQTLDLDYDDFLGFSDYSLKWALDVVSGDLVSTYGFLGLLGDKQNNPKNEYAKALLLNNNMRYDPHIRNYLIASLKKKINDMKMGKLYIKGCFKAISPDLILFAKYIGGLDLEGEIPSGHFYAIDNKRKPILDKNYLGRNPHITESENVVLQGHDSYLLDKYCSHLPNLLQLNNYDILPYLLNGCDYDGDIVLLSNNELLIKGSRDMIPAVNIEDGVVAKKQLMNGKNILEVVLMGFDSRVGEISNLSTCYLNKIPKDKQKKEVLYRDYVEMLSIFVGKDIDSVKTGIKDRIPNSIVKYAKPYPYFMKFKSDYYAKHKKFDHSHSNMNRLAKDISSWERQIDKHVRKVNKDIRFDYEIMYIDGFEPKNDIIKKIEDIYFDFNEEVKQIQLENRMLKEYNKYKDEFVGYGVSKSVLIESKIDWEFYYNQYRELLLPIVDGDIKLLTSYLVYVAYELHPKKSKKFVWGICPDGVLKNVNKENLYLPIEDEKGEFEYLGKHYKLEQIGEN